LEEIFNANISLQNPESMKVALKTPCTDQVAKLLVSNHLDMTTSPVIGVIRGERTAINEKLTHLEIFHRDDYLFP